MKKNKKNIAPKGKTKAQAQAAPATKSVTHVLQIGDVIFRQRKQGGYGYKKLNGKIVLEQGADLLVIVGIEDTLIHSDDGDYTITSYRFYNGRHKILSDSYYASSLLDGKTEVVGIVSHKMMRSIYATRPAMEASTDIIPLEQVLVYDTQLAPKVWEIETHYINIDSPDATVKKVLDLILK